MRFIIHNKKRTFKQLIQIPNESLSTVTIQNIKEQLEKDQQTRNPKYQKRNFQFYHLGKELTNEMSMESCYNSLTKYPYVFIIF